ncbi:hypothetical protein FRC03_005539 [Tulasnella sp. 419]|nr:hypothetical protein FRC03_005539 [Tulasnella sp. 419]
MRPVLKGSPKLLGWNVDEKEEQAAWVKLMADAMSSSIFDVMTEEQRLIELTERQETEKELQSKRDLYQIWLENWEDDHVELHWRINVSLDGNHTWLLQPRITGSALGSTALSSTYTASLAHQTVDAEVDTRDLVNHSHTEMSIQTETEPVPVKTYGEAAIQAPEDPEVPIGALAPLDGEPSSLLQVGSPDMPRPGTPSQVSISSPPGTPASRIPRLAPAAKASMTSLLIDSPVSSNTALVTEAPSESTTTQPTTAKPTPSRSSTKILGALRGSPSLKSLSLRRQPSTVSTKDAVSTASGTVVGTPSKSVTSGGLPTPVEENPPARPGVMSRQTNKVLDAFKPSQSMRTLGLRRQPSQQSTKGSIPTGAAPPTPEPTTDGSDTSSVSKPKNTRFLSAVRKMQKTNSVMQAWKP